MKKILSLLVLLVTTITAMATDYVADCVVSCNNQKSTMSGATMSVVDNGDGTYNVTLKSLKSSALGMDFGDFKLSNLSGTTQGGVTTISVENVNGKFTSGDYTDAPESPIKSFVCKFNADKLYAEYGSGSYLKLNSWQRTSFNATFGTDEGFESTGGGSTGGGETGGETSSIVTVLENHTNDGSRFSRSFKIDWDKQKVVMSIDPTSCGNDLEHIVGLGVDCTQWDGALHVYNKYFDKYGSPEQTYNRQMLQAYFPMPVNNNNTGVFDRKSPFSIEVSKDKGFVVDGEVKISASQMTSLFAQANLTVGSGQGGDAASHAKYNYIKVVPLNWTEVPPVTVAETFTYDQDAYDGNNETNGTAKVKVYKMTDGTYTMEITEPIATKVGEISVGTDSKGRTTYIGEVWTNVESGVKYVVNGVVYEKDGANHLYMTLIGENNVKYVIGEDPDAPKVVSTLPFENVAYTTSYNESGTATVTFTEMSDGTHPMTFVSEAIKATADNLTKGTDAKGRTTYTGEAKRTDTSFEVKFTVKAVVYGEPDAQKLYMTMDNGSGFVVTVGEDPDHVAPEPEIEGTVVEGSKDFAAKGSKFEWSNIAIDWNKQKLVAVIDLSSCKGTSENILSVGQNIGAWKIGGWHFYYTVAEKRMKSDYLATGGAHPVSDPKTGVEPGTVRIELSKAEGCTIDGVSYNALYDNKVTGTWQSNTEDFWNLTSVNIGSKEGDNRSNAVIKYVTVVNLPVTVKEEKTFNEALYMVQGTTSNKVADAKVVVKEMTDETINMSLTYTIGNSNVEYTSTELTKGTDAKGRTTYTGKVAKDAMTFDVAGVVYEKDNVSRLYMTMTATNMNIVVGENPDTEVQKPVVYKNTLKVVRGTNTQTYENAEVSVLAKGEGMYEVTLPKFSDMDNVPGEWGPITFQAKGVEESGKVVLTATDQEFTLTNTGWKNDVVKVSMKGEIESEMLKATFNVNHSSMSGYNYTLYYGVEAPEIVTELSNKTYKSNLRIADQTSEDENAYLFQTDEATVNIIKYSDKTYKITLKQITLNSKTSDLVFTGKAVESEVDPGEGGAVATEGTMVQATADAETQNFLGGAVNAQFMWQDVSDTEIRMSFSLEGKTLSLGGEFNYEKTPEPPVEPTFPMENYQADGKGFVVSTDIDWSKQKFQAIIDATKCNAASTEDIFGFGAEATAWFKNIHVCADKGSYKAYFQPAAEKDNNNTTVTIADQSNITIEVSKAKGLTVDGVVVIAAEQLTGIFDLTTVKFGSGENSQYSNALYKSVKLVDLPKDPETGINAINAEVANGEAQLFTVNGVKLNKLQEGLNIVRTADGKVKKVLVK